MMWEVAGAVVIGAQKIVTWQLLVEHETLKQSDEAC